MTMSTAVSRIGPYRIEELIGRGGTGEVYRAFDTRRARTVALKVLAPDTAGDEQYCARFRRESDSTARLQDPHVIPIHDFGEIDGRLYIDMRLVNGVGLDELLRGGPLDPHRAVALVTQVAEALADAHRNGVVHRDVKPSNILVTPSDFVYLVDFGIARSGIDAQTPLTQTPLTQTGATVGTLAYTAPERFEGGLPDGRSDVYALACVLAECLIGKRPFDGTSLPSLMKAHIVSEPPRPSLHRADLPPGLDDVVARGMAKDPILRFQSARDLARAAQDALSSAPTATRLFAPPPPTTLAAPPAVPAPPKEPSRSRRALALAASAVLIALASGYLGFTLGCTADPEPTAPAEIPVTTVAAAPTATTPWVQAPGGTDGDVSRSATFTYTVEGNYTATSATPGPTATAPTSARPTCRDEDGHHRRLGR